jgi:hypothetical protein
MSQVSCEETAANLDALKERPSKAPRSEDVAQADAEGD